MKLILIKDDPKLGKKNDIIEVSDNYAAFYLIPKKIAVVCNVKNKKILDDKLSEIKASTASALLEAEELKTKIEKISLNFTLHSFHSKLAHRISSKKIEKVLLDKYKIEINKKQILLKNPLSKEGLHHVKIKIFKNVVADLKIQINAINENEV